MNTIEKELILKFLQRSYPVRRLKFEHRFRRTIIFGPNDVVVLSDKKSLEFAYEKLISIVFKVFDINDESSQSVLKTFLMLR